MRKNISLFLLISFMILFSSCGAGKGNTLNEEIKKGPVVSTDGINSPNSIGSPVPTADPGNKNAGVYEISKANYSNKEVKIEYPQINGLYDSTKEKAVNEMIRTEALKVLNYYDSDVDELSLDIVYEIDWKSENLLSIQYSGTGYLKRTAHPNNLFYTTNIDVNSGKRVRLADIVKIDEGFTNKMTGGEFRLIAPDFLEKSMVLDSVNAIPKEDLVKMFQNADSLDNTSTENQSDIFSFFTGDLLGISLGIMGHAAGDHAEIGLKYQDISSSIKTENEVWKEFSGMLGRQDTGSADKSSEIKEKGFDIIEDQSFWTELDRWGKVRFVSCTGETGGLSKLKFFLTDKNEKILYTFPDFYGNRWSMFYEFQAVAFRDVNKDGLKDIVIIADYMTGVGPEGAVPFHVGSIYFRKENGFANSPELDDEINSKKKNETIDMLVKYAEGKVK